MSNEWRKVGSHWRTRICPPSAIQIKKVNSQMAGVATGLGCMPRVSAWIRRILAMIRQRSGQRNTGQDGNDTEQRWSSILLLSSSSFTGCVSSYKLLFPHSCCVSEMYGALREVINWKIVPDLASSSWEWLCLRENAHVCAVSTLKRLQPSDKVSGRPNTFGSTTGVIGNS